MVKCTKSQVRRLKTALYWKGDPARRQRIQMVLLREGGMIQPSIAAAMGVSLNIHDIKAAYEKTIGHETSNSTVYNLLARHGWRKLMPRPFHPKRNLAAQNAFKKTAFPML